MTDTEDLIQLSPDIFWDMGFRSMTRSQVGDLLSEFYDTLEVRVGLRIAEALDSNQLARFERIVAGHDETAALTWLKQNVPGYREVVRLEYNHMVNTLRSAASLAKSARTDQPITDSMADDRETAEQ